MNESRRKELIKTCWDVHNAIEDGYLEHPAIKGDAEWLEKQRLLLADMAIHLLQTSLKPGEIEIDKLQNNLHAILTITDQFLPNAGLKKATENLY